MNTEIKKVKKVAKNAVKVAAGVKIATKVGKDATKAIAAAKTVKKLEKKIKGETKCISIKIDEELNKKLEKYCKQHKLSKSAATIKAIEELVK